MHTKASTHDYTLFKKSRLVLPSNVELGLDLGYDGAQVDFPSLNCKVPFKRRSPRRGKCCVVSKMLSLEQQAFNRELSGERVVVEHTFVGWKSFAFGLIRLETGLNTTKPWLVLCGLVNFRILQTTVV